MADMNALKDLLKTKGLTYTETARLLGISYQSLMNKLNGTFAFTLGEAFKLREILKMEWKEWRKIFNG